MKFFFRHLLVVFIIYCTSRVLYFNSESSGWIGFIGCHGQPYSNFKQRINTDKKLSSTDNRKNAISTRIIQNNSEGIGLDHQHAVRIALISDFKKAHCAGTLQNALYVITAAHCVNHVDALELIVTAGTFDLAQNRSVTSIKIHEEWNNQTTVHDIALLKLNSSLVLSVGQLMPAELGQPQLPNASILFAYITGWGLFNFDVYNNLTYPQHEVQIHVSLIDVQTCKTVYRNIGKEVQLNQICAERQGGTGPCTGDDGAPLTIKIRSGIYTRNYVVGILLSYEGCATGVPHIYTDLDKYKSWIYSNAGY